MSNTWARKSMQVAAIAAGIVLLGGGVAQAAGSSAPATERVPVVEGGTSLDQGATNICGNVFAEDSIVINFADCDAVNVAAADDDDDHRRHHRHHHRHHDRM